MSIYVDQASKPVAAAETRVLKELRKHRSGCTTEDLLRTVTVDADIEDDEVQEAIWRLLASGDVEISDDLKLKSVTS